MISNATKIGLALAVLGCILWLGLLAIPFLDLSVGQKAALGVVVFVVAEVLFWGGTLLAGRKLIARFMDKLWPRKWRFWPRKKHDSSSRSFSKSGQQDDDPGGAEPSLRPGDGHDSAVEDHAEEKSTDQRIP